MSTFLFTVAWPDGTGAARMACSFAEALRARRHHVVFACGPVPKTAQRAGHQMLDDVAAHDVDVCHVEQLAGRFTPSVPYVIRDLVRAKRADAVVSFTQRDQASGMWGARLAKVPGILCAQNLHAFSGGRLLRAIKIRAFASIMRGSVSLAIATGKRVQRELVQSLGIREEKTFVLPNAIDVEQVVKTDRAEAASVRRELGVEDDELMFVNVGRIDTQKGQDVLVEALAKRRDRSRLKLVFIGDVSAGANAGPMQRYKARLVQRIGALHMRDSIVFAGWRHDVPRILHAADVYVHAARWEGPPLPLAAMEAMAAGLPVIVTDCVGYPDHFINGEHGYVVPSEDAHALAGAIEQVALAAPAERRRMGAACRDLVEREYNIRVIGNRFVDCVEAIL